MPFRHPVSGSFRQIRLVCSRFQSLSRSRGAASSSASHTRADRELGKDLYELGTERIYEFASGSSAALQRSQGVRLLGALAASRARTSRLRFCYQPTYPSTAPGHRHSNQRSDESKTCQQYECPGGVCQSQIAPATRRRCQHLRGARGFPHSPTPHRADYSPQASADR
jgi:hypothetical protein